MKNLKLLILLLPLLLVSTAVSADEEVLLQRVSHGLWTAPQFSVWEDAGVSLTGRQDTYLAILNEPRPEDVKRVVFISAGQQSDNPLKEVGTGDYGDGYKNVLTGQPDNYKQGMRQVVNVQSALREIDDRSLAARLRASGRFPNESTLFILAFDARFGYFRDGSEKQKREEAFWRFLTSKFDPAKTELIVLAGQSRGGALMFRLAGRLRRSADFQHIPLVVQGYDPVCTNPKLVNNVVFPNIPLEPYLVVIGRDMVKNPLSESDKSCWRVDMDVLFPTDQREDLAVLDLHAGAKVGLHSSIRSFTWYKTDTDVGWWRQKWLNLEHEDMGGNYDHSWQTIDTGLNHIFEFMDKLDSTSYKPTQHPPVDVNGDGLSDVVERIRKTDHQLLLRTEISRGDGTFTPVDTMMSHELEVDRFPMYSGYFNDDDQTDVLLVANDKYGRNMLYTKLSNGDGTYSQRQFRMPIGMLNEQLPLLLGDVDGDGLTDVIVRNQSQQGLVVRVYYPLGDGTFRFTQFVAGDEALGETLRAHAGDANGDKKADLIYLYQGSAGLEFRTRLSNGDGTFQIRKFNPGGWVNAHNLQSFVADVNRDKKTDIILLERDKVSEVLKITTYVSLGDGTYQRHVQDLPEGREVDKYEGVVGDFNRDYRTDVMLRSRDPQNGLTLHLYTANADGSYTRSLVQSGDGQEVDRVTALTGNYNQGRETDLWMPSDRPGGLTAQVKLNSGNNTFSPVTYHSGARFDRFSDPYRVRKSGFITGLCVLPMLSGPVYWNGGATFRVRQRERVLQEQGPVKQLPGQELGPTTPTRPTTPTPRPPVKLKSAPRFVPEQPVKGATKE